MDLTKLRKWRPKLNALITAFCIPFLLMLLLMIYKGVTPFGNRMMLYSDEWHQYFPFFKAFRNAVRNGDSLLYNWNVGMGIDYLAQISYYLASPLNWLSILLPSDSMVLPYFTLLLPVKLGLASMFFALFLKKTFHKNDLSIAVFGSFYGLCAWALGYQWNIMWLDTFALLPLVALGTVYLLRDRKVVLYTITLFLSIFANYYIGFFTCIFVLLLFICYQICRCKSVSRFFMDLARIAVFSAVAIAMTAILTLPAWASLGKTYSIDDAFYGNFYMNIVDYELYAPARDAWLAFKTAKEAGEPIFILLMAAIWKTIPPTLEGMSQIAGNMSGGLTPTFMDGLPNVYSGVATLFLSFLFLMAKNVKVRDKICCVALILFLGASCVIRELDYIWHGFHFPNMIPFRFSFIFSFVMLYMAYRAFLARRLFKPVHLLFAAFLAAQFFLLSMEKETLIATWNSLGDFITLGINCVKYRFEGDAQAWETGIASLKAQYHANGSNYIFLAFNVGFLTLYSAIALVFIVRQKMPKGATWDERKQIAKSNIRHRHLCTILLLVVMCFEIVANVASFERNYSYTSTKNYPLASQYTASMIRYMKEREEKAGSLFYRAETTHTQTLNDGALNDYYGISAFTSSANVKTTRFLTAMGLASQDNWNRYSYEDGSPVANLFLNLKYMIERNGELVENPYFNNVHHYGDVYLLENNYYLPVGFLAESGLESAEMTMKSMNSFANQNILFSAATGIQKSVWNTELIGWLEITGEDTQITSTTGSYCNYYASGNGGSVVYTYNVQEAGFLCLDVSMTARNSFMITCNAEKICSESVVLPQVFSVCWVEPGDVVQLRATCAASENSNMDIKAGLLNDTVFREGYDILNASTLNLTAFETDRMEGTITCNRDGLLYTSIPDDGNWVAYVDGKKVETKVVGGAMIALDLTEGTHQVKFVYRNMDFIYGVTISMTAALIFLGLIYLYDWKRWNVRFQKASQKVANLFRKIKNK